MALNKLFFFYVVGYSFCTLPLQVLAIPNVSTPYAFIYLYFFFKLTAFLQKILLILTDDLGYGEVNVSLKGKG